jgi:hypothetical protein
MTNEALRGCLGLDRREVRMTFNSANLRARRIDVGGFTLHAEELGAGGPDLLFLHYWGGSARAWRPVIEHLAATNSLSHEQRAPAPT